MREKPSTLRLLALVALVALVLCAPAAWAATEEKPAVVEDTAEVTGPGPEGLQWSYAVKFVCGFNQFNGEITPDGEIRGEPPVKLGNYATEINIFNPIQDNFIFKKFLLLVRDGFVVGREPNFVKPSAFDEIQLPMCTATMDDCNRIAELVYGFVPTPMPLTIGFLVLQSFQELDVTAVYTSEVCTDWVFAGPLQMCSTADGRGGAGMSIDVEQITGRRLIP